MRAARRVSNTFIAHSIEVVVCEVAAGTIAKTEA
jgi:hypothetical protein